MENLTTTYKHSQNKIESSSYSDKGQRQLKSLDQILSQNKIILSRKTVSNSSQTIPKIELAVHKEYIVLGEPFQIVESEDIISLGHKNWSLQGSGVSLLKAENDLIYNAIEMYEVYSNIEEIELTKEAKSFQNYLEIIYYYGPKKAFKNPKSTK